MSDNTTDIGDAEPVAAFIEEMGLAPDGVFISHAHFDHIYGLLKLLERYSDCKVYDSVCEGGLGIGKTEHVEIL